MTYSHNSEVMKPLCTHMLSTPQVLCLLSFVMKVQMKYICLKER